MKQILLLLSLVFLGACSQKNPYAELPNTKDDYPVVPLPNEIEVKTGRFLLNNNTVLHYEKDFEKEANFFKQYVKEIAGVDIQLSEGALKSGNTIVFSKSDKGENESYELEVTPTTIELSAPNAKGIFYGVQTLRQLIAEQKSGEKIDYVIPSAKIEDAPRFSYRGMHLDVGRHMFPVEFIKKYIDLIALHKMDKFHWHLTEDQGWRIEIKKYPKLTEVGAWRDETAVKKHFPGSGLEDDTFIGDGVRYGGFYTQEEAREIVKYAADRHITVIPEIDMPGHMLAALASYPELGNGTGPYQVWKWWGVSPQILAPKEETFKFLEDVLTEIMDIFPSEYIHIGGDEAPKKEWKESAQAQQLIKDLGYKDDVVPGADGRKHTKEEKLQSYFIGRIEKFLNSKGRQIIGWDEILEGGLAPNATVMSWRGIEGGIAAAQQNHNVIMTPGGYCYFDHYQSEDKDNEPFAICCFTPVERVYSYDPVPEVLTKEQAKYIIGTQGNVWTEYIPTAERVEYMSIPRMAALSEVAWTQKSNKDYASFLKRMEKLRKHYDRMNVNYATHIFNQEQ